IRKGRAVRGYTRRNRGRASLITIAVGGATLAVSVPGLMGGNAVKLNAGTRERSQASAGPLRLKMQAEFKRAEAALIASKFKTNLAVRFDTDCTAHSNGQVRTYFQSTPCTFLARAYIQVGEPGDNLILVAISWVEMPSVASVKDLKRLIDEGVGNITELSLET